MVSGCYINWFSKQLKTGGSPLVETNWTSTYQPHAATDQFSHCDSGYFAQLLAWNNGVLCSLSYWCSIYGVYHWRFILAFPKHFQFHPLFIPAPEEIRTAIRPCHPCLMSTRAPCGTISLGQPARRCQVPTIIDFRMWIFLSPTCIKPKWYWNVHKKCIL